MDMPADDEGTSKETVRLGFMTLWTSMRRSYTMMDRVALGPDHVWL